MNNGWALFKSRYAYPSSYRQRGIEMNPNQPPVQKTRIGEDLLDDVVISRSSTKVPEAMQPKPTPVDHTSTGGDAPIVSSNETKSDPSATSLQLPSNFLFYPFKSISVTPLKGYHQAKFARAAREKLTRHIVEAVTTLLPDGVDAMDLTVPDFYYLLYWLRLNYYTKAQLVHRGVCKDHKHLAEVRDSKKPLESLTTIITIGKTSLKESYLEAGFDREFELNPELAENGLSLHPLCMRDVVDLEENLSDVPDYVELEYLADLASFLRIDGKPLSSLKERIQLAEGLSPDALECVAEYRDLVSNYGVIEILKFNCQECGAENETAVSISAHSFL